VGGRLSKIRLDAYMPSAANCRKFAAMSTRHPHTLDYQGLLLLERHKSSRAFWEFTGLFDRYAVPTRARDVNVSKRILLKGISRRRDRSSRELNSRRALVGKSLVAIAVHCVGKRIFRF